MRKLPIHQAQQYAQMFWQIAQNLIRAWSGTNGRATMAQRRFLFLQGPHGPFFFELSRKLVAAGHSVHRVGFNRGDEYFWPEKVSYTPYLGDGDGWKAFLADFVTRSAITDLVIYGDARPVHAAARTLAGEMGLRLHCFEEGYLRPYWITYERGGSNGNSELMQFSMDDIRARIGPTDLEVHEAPAQWGPVWRHTILGSIYHANILFRNRKYVNYRTHRKESVRREWLLHCKRLAMYMPRALAWRWKTRRLLARGLPYHVALLQLGHDASVQHYSSVRSMEEFVHITVEGFAKGAAQHHQLVFKTHPLEDGRENIPRLVQTAAREAGVEDRVWYIPGGRLGLLLDGARSAITINSTAGQQALWRGLPLKTLGQAVYVKPEFVSGQSVRDFFADPKLPDRSAYRIYRQFLLETSQISGGFYTALGRRNACRQLVDLLLADAGPYERFKDRNDTVDRKLDLVGSGVLTK